MASESAGRHSLRQIFKILGKNRKCAGFVPPAVPHLTLGAKHLSSSPFEPYFTGKDALCQLDVATTSLS